MKRSIQQLFVLLLVVAVLVTACGPQPTQMPPVGETPPGSVIHGEAVVEAIDILILESFPVQLNVVARGNLPDGCTEIGEILQKRTEKEFQVTITTVRPADAACAEALEPFEESISLDVYGLPAGSYMVNVNGTIGTFELAVDNVMPTEPPSDVEPPPAILEVDGREQVSGIGNYCWPQRTGEQSEEVIVCADAFAVITPEEPLVVSSPSTARFRLALEEEPDRLFLKIAPATSDDDLRIVGDGWRAWRGGQGERRELALLREPQTELDLPPGLYVLDLQAGWDEWGDVSYGFLVEVQSPLPVLSVDESPVVAAEVDGPGHFEYTDRLGEQILARIEGLRAYAAEQELGRTNASLALFGYRLDPRFDAEWDRTFYDLSRDGEAEPVLAGLSHVWPVSVNASGTDFVLAAENAPNVFPLYLQVQAGSVEPWDADQGAYLPAAYVDDALARVNFTGFPTITYQVKLDDRVIYSGTTAALGAYMPLRSLTTWDGHWVLEVDDHLIMDGQDMGQVLGYDAAFGFSLIHGRPFYFFEQGGKVRISYGGRTLPFVYEQVFHNQCCEAAIHNVETPGDVVLFHALWNGTWYFVEAGVYDGEMAGTYRYTAPEGWSFRYPMHWDRLDEELGLVQDTTTGKTVTFASQPASQVELERWLESEIARKLAATEADNTLAEPLTAVQEGALTVYRYAILSQGEASETLLRSTIFFDGQRRYEFYAAIPPVAEEEYEAIVASFQPAGKR